MIQEPKELQPTPEQVRVLDAIGQALSTFGTIERFILLPMTIGLRDLCLIASVSGGREFSCFIGTRGDIWSYQNKQKVTDPEAVFAQLEFPPALEQFKALTESRDSNKES